MQEAIDCLSKEAFEGHKVDVCKVEEPSELSNQVEDLPDDYETNF